MPLPTTYTWPLPAPTGSSPPPPFNPGPPVTSLPSFSDPRKLQFGPGIRFANVPGGKASNAQQLNGKGQVFHVSTVIGAHGHADSIDDKSGVVQSRRRSNFKRVPAAVRHYETRQSDRFGNPVTPGVGQYPPGYQFVTIDPGFWNATALQNVKFPVSRYTALPLADLRIFKAGGLDATGTPSSGSEIYATGSGIWANLPDMPGQKSLGASALLPNGDVLVLGGSGSSAADSTSSFHYSIVQNSWKVTSVPSGTIVPRQDFQIIALNDGRILAPGGCGLLSGTSQFTGSELFIPSGTGGTYGNPPNEYWTGSISIPLYPFNRRGYTLTKLNDGSVLMLGGYDPQTLQNYAHALRYVPSNISLPGSRGTWIIEASMSFARSGHAACLLDDGKVLVAGGNGGPGSNLAGAFPWPMGAAQGSRVAIPEAEIFNPGNATLTDSGWSGSITTRIGSVTASDGGIYTTGSFAWSAPLVYGSGTWSLAGQMRRKRARFAIMPLRLDGHEGRVLVAGGFDDNTYLTSSELFDYEFKTWTEITPMQQPSAWVMAFLLSNNPYQVMVPSGETTGSLPNALSVTQILQTTG